MKLFKLLFLILSISVIQSCESYKPELSMGLEGPFYKETIIKKFGLDSFPYDIDSREYYVAHLNNNSDDEITIITTENHEIYPDSAWYHTYEPYSALERSWHSYRHEKPSSGLRRANILPGSSKLFWFSNHYDDYMDTLRLYFTVSNGRLHGTLAIQHYFEQIEKPNTQYELIEKYIDDTPQPIRISVEGPFTYKAINSLLNIDIPYSIDSEEAFIFDIKNESEGNLYIERWDNNEINIDTIWTRSPFRQTSREYIWVMGMTWKGEKPIDTLVLEPGMQHKFWDSHPQIWPTTDSIVFIESFRTDSYLVTTTQLFELRKK